MSEILCRWLNEELRLSKAVDPKTFAKDFSSGYLIGEVLHKYELQNDFNMFTKKDTATSKLNNFTRVEPTFKLLGISFNINTAHDLMQEKQGVATRVLYQLYVTLEKKKNADISGTLMEIMQPAAKAGLHKKEHEIYSDRLHHMVKRDSELKLQNISQHYEEKRLQLNSRFVMTYPIHQKRQPRVQDEKKPKKLAVFHQKHNDMTVQVPKPPPYTSQLNLKRRQQQQQCREQQVQTVQTEIAQFEMRKKLVTSGFASSSSGQLSGGSSQGCEVPGSGTKLILQSSSKYIQDIRQRLEENAVAREQRDKRRDRFLVEQLKAHEAQEEAQREEQLVKRLTRQTQQEQRLAAQLLQIRMQKDVIRQNRLLREQQYQQRRKRDFQEYLEREAALAQQAKLDRAEEIREKLEFCNRVAAERAQSRYKKHFERCKDNVEQIVDLATKVGEYRLLSGILVPQKLMREWKELLFNGLPLYESKCQQFEFSAPLDPVELEKQEILISQDYDEYTNMVGDWAWPEGEGETKPSLTNNNILGHVVARLRNIIHQPIQEPFPPSPLPFPPFTIKACVLGKFCSGKTTFLAKLAEAHGIYVLSADTLIEEALSDYRNGKPSMRAMHGAAAEEELRKGNTIPNELLVGIIVEAIRKVPAQSGWILDGFPVDITQAYLLEKALGGSVDEGKGAVSSRTDLAADPNPPKPPPPPRPALDLALLLDIPNECVLTRSYSQIQDSAAATTSYPTDKNLYQAQIPHRITAFHDTWPKLQKWFGRKQNILVRVDADVDEEELYKRVESIVQQVMMQKQEATLPPVDQPEDRTEFYSSLKKEKRSQSGRSLHSRGHSRKVSTSSVTCVDSQEVPMNPPESASPCQGSSTWVYVDEPLSRVIPEYLCQQWDVLCDSYVNAIKTAMQDLRSQRTATDHHLFNIREKYKNHLGQSGVKQELVSQWQKDFNSTPDEMRKETDTKTELLEKLDDLLERLWDTTENDKEESERQKAALMDGDWLEEQSDELVNQHSTLMQAELERFQQTLTCLKVYYLSMYEPEVSELPVCVHPLDTSEDKDQDESTEPADPSASSQKNDGVPKKKTKSSPDEKSKSEVETEPVEPTPHEKLISHYEEALTAISNLMSAEFHQEEMKEQEEELPENEKASESSNKGEKGKKSSEKKKGSPSPPAATSPAPAEDINSERTKISKEKIRKNKIDEEYRAAIDHEANAAKVRIALVKDHGLMMVNSLQSRVEQTLSSMDKWLEAHYLTEMTSIDQLSEVIRYHIEAGAKVQKELVLECIDLDLNGDCHMVASPAPPSSPPPLEKPTLSILTITQLQSLYQALYREASSGFINSRMFSEVVNSIERDNWPEPWKSTDVTQLDKIAALLQSDSGSMMDWRQFLLGAALPWPTASLSQLLVVLQRFKAADTGHTGYINEEQYLQTELWFSSEDPSEPLPDDRLDDLQKFFFQLFADHSVSPLQLDYESMLQYFAADPDPTQGFIRALSLVLGQQLEYSSQTHLVKSMPSIDEATELSSSDLDGDYKEEETPFGSSSLLVEQKVSISDLLAVICPKANPHVQDKDTAQLVQIFGELADKPEDRVPFSVLSQHPLFKDLMVSTKHQLIDVHDMLLIDQDEEEDGSSVDS